MQFTTDTRYIYLYRHSPPPRAKLENSHPRLHSGPGQNVMDFPQLGCLEIRRLGGGEEVPPQTSLLVGPEGTGVHHLLAQESFEEVVGLVVGIRDVESCPTQRLAKEGDVKPGNFGSDSTQCGTEAGHLIAIVKPKLRDVSVSSAETCEIGPTSIIPLKLSTSISHIM